jgi:Protein of unknown function (DUF3048) N-terminal domain/Protein of unknown function (DUF3048) C-terminal domain
MSRTPCTPARLAAALLTACLTLTGCTGEEQPKAAPPSPAEEKAKTQKRPPEHWPLTGETAKAPLPRHRAVVVKIENTSSGAPQVGLGSADLVVEELVEGGLTRLAAFYYSKLPSTVGPVRSARGTDIGLVKPAKGTLVASGGAPVTMRRIRHAHVVTATEGTPGYYRADGRVAPYDLFLHPQQLPEDKMAGPRPPDYLPWGSAKQLSGGKPAKEVTATFSAGSETEWTWNGKVWHRHGSYAAEGQEFRTDNILALEVKQTSAGYTDPAGNPVPESVLKGKGDATLFHEGKAYRATWMKKSLESPIRLVTAKGAPLRVPPGNTWIELVPANASGDLEFGK